MEKQGRMEGRRSSCQLASSLLSELAGWKHRLKHTSGVQPLKLRLYSKSLCQAVSHFMYQDVALFCLCGVDYESLGVHVFVCVWI